MPWVVAALLVAVTAIVYAPVRLHGFLNWDDPDYVTESPHVSAGLTWRGVMWAFTGGHAANWHPLTWLSHMLDVQLFGVHAGPHLIINLLYHLVGTVLLFEALRRMTGAVGRSAFVAALFAVHPLHVESVAWVAERKDVLSTVFWMLTMLAYAAYVRQPRSGRFVLVLVLFALGLLTKPMLVTLPIVLLLLDVWPLDRAPLRVAPAVAVPGGRRPAPQSWGHLMREKLPLLALALGSSIVTFLVQRRGGAMGSLAVFPLRHRVANALMVYVEYIGKAIWPMRLAAFYPYPSSFSVWSVAGAALGLTAMTVFALRSARRYPYVLVGWLWYLGTLVPVIGIVQVGDQSMADRYTYVPLIGIFIIVAWGIPDLLARWVPAACRHSVVLAAVAVVIIACYALLARVQVGYWSDSVSLWQHAVSVTSENPRAREKLGSAFRDRGQLTEALANYAEAERSVPADPVIHNDIGLVLTRQGKAADALTEFMTAVRLRPAFAEARGNLGNALAAAGRFPEAIDQYLQALAIDPHQSRWHYSVALLLFKQDRLDDAVQHLQAALRITPDFAEARSALDDVMWRKKTGSR
jgi:Flp pilus assembly protein TadD